MNLFSISDLSRFSGIKPHTIRMWEQRYNALHPNRSEGNTRYYDNNQLRRLLNIVSLMDSDRKISELCAMPDKKLFSLIAETAGSAATGNIDNDYFIPQLIAAGMAYDENWFDKIFSHCHLRYGLRDTYTRVVYPMLVRVGLMWASDTIMPAYEHFISNLVRRKMQTAIDTLPPPDESAESWVLFLPEEEFHETGLLISSYLIRLSGHKVIYLGADVPLDSLSSVIKETRPDNLLSFLVRKDSGERMYHFMETLVKLQQVQGLFVAADPKILDNVKISRKVQQLHSIEDLENVLINTVEK